MSDKRLARYHGKRKDGTVNRKYAGIISRWNTYHNSWVYTIVYRWTPRTDELAQIAGGTKGKSIKIREAVPADEDGRFRLDSAWRLKCKRDKGRATPDWMPPHIEEKFEDIRRDREGDRRSPLLYETARDKFMEEESKDYADKGKGARSAFKRLGLFFNGGMLDEVTRPDIREYFTHRTTNTGVFEGSHATTARSAETEIRQLSALYTWLIDIGHDSLVNPCHRPRTRKKDSPLAPYRPKHVKITPGPDTLAKIFTATKKAKPGANGAAGRDLIRDEHRVLWMLCYHTAARPESEPCRLRHGDVKFLADGWAEVAYTDAKNVSSNRTIPVPPEVAEALRGIMLDAPTRFEKDERETWGTMPIFRKQRSAEPWNRFSYANAWKAAVSVVPGIERMWVRDLRPTAKTQMRKSGIRRSVSMAFMGHKPPVHDGYDTIDTADLRGAAEALRLANLAAKAASQAASSQGDT